MLSIDSPYIYIYNTYAEHRCTLITDPNEPTSLCLAAPNGTNWSNLTPPDVSPLYNHPAQNTPTLGFPQQPDHASIQNPCHPDLHPTLRFHGIHWWRQRRGTMISEVGPELILLDVDPIHASLLDAVDSAAKAGIIGCNRMF
jgi:hypothetical protein